MINLLDNLIRNLIMSEVSEITDEAQVRFQPPDDVWRNYIADLTVNGNPVNALNIYLVDLRENRTLRSNERIRNIENGIIGDDPAPNRVDCHYLLSAWSSASVTPSIELTLDEHALLYETAAILFRTKVFSPSRVYPSGSVALNSWPVRFRDMDFPIVILPVDGFSKLSEFWNSMGQSIRWKPVIYLVVTLPVELLKDISGPMVTTRITEYRLISGNEAAEVWIQIGGHVINNTVNPSVPVSNAWVMLEDAGGTQQQTITDNDGRFTFKELKQGGYTLHLRVQGYAPINQPIQVPSIDGNYDILIT